MPTPRRASRPSTPASTTSSAPQFRSGSTPATGTPHHHKTADELAAEEAAEILHLSTPTTSRLRGASLDVLDGGSARALRHRRLNEVRQEEEHRKEETVELEGDPEEAREHDEVSRGIDVATTISHSDSIAESSKSSSHDDELPSAGLSTGQIFGETSQLNAGESEVEPDDSESESEDDSENDSSSTASSNTVSTSDDESDSDPDEDEEDERMERLLQAAKEAARAKGKSKAAAAPDAGHEADETVLQFDEDQVEKKKGAPIPDLSIPKLPNPHLTFSKDGRASAATTLPRMTESGPSKRRSPNHAEEQVPELDNRPYDRGLSRREKSSQPRKATTSELWSTIPVPRTDLLPQMKRDYQALALANSLDPKRFMKGGSRSDKVPESFAIGTMVETSRHIRDTTLTKDRKYRPGQVVAGLIRDDDTGSYAKRKYGDLQWSRMENGRGRGGKKQAKW